MSVDFKSCQICMEEFTTGTTLQNRQPMIVCGNGHCICASCLEMSAECPFCREPKLTALILNRALIEMLETTASPMNKGSNKTISDKPVIPKKPANIGKGTSRQEPSPTQTPPELKTKVKADLKCEKGNSLANCAHCNKPIQDEYTEAMGKRWHPNHFMCHHCSQSLSHKKHFERSGYAYCENDFHELFSPRCACCSDPIKDGALTAMGKSWHKCHFMCAHCGCELSGKKFFEKNGEPYCERDFHNLFSPRCAYCHDPIQKRNITAMGKSWHPEHFTCHHCGKSLDKLEFYTESNKPYCIADHQKLFN